MAALLERRCGQTRPKFGENTESEAVPTLIRPWSPSKSHQLPCADVVASLSVLAPPRIDQSFASGSYVKRQKNDAADAEAICEAASRPTMSFVAVKTKKQQARGMLFRTRDLLVRQRTQTINTLRGHLAEFGVVAPKGAGPYPSPGVGA